MNRNEYPTIKIYKMVKNWGFVNSPSTRIFNNRPTYFPKINGNKPKGQYTIRVARTAPPPFTPSAPCPNLSKIAERGGSNKGMTTANAPQNQYGFHLSMNDFVRSSSKNAPHIGMSNSQKRTPHVNPNVPKRTLLISTRCAPRKMINKAKLIPAFPSFFSSESSSFCICASWAALNSISSSLDFC